MPYYCLNQNVQPNGDHEVHVIGCTYTPRPENQLQLGLHNNCVTAVAQAKRDYGYLSRINGCATCSAPCHTS